MAADWRATARAGFEQVLDAIDQRVPVTPPQPPVVPPLAADVLFAVSF